ncbi:hypothetical protein F4801DRAFT_580395 [Xylaria longipes]|nr:hypothetical protein F4801DRAFT_580395 [Xylaria longipes]
MAQVNKPVESEIANTIVETNNFHQVLEHFNSAGGLKHKETRLEIECQICLSKNLALVNLEQEKPVSDTHEQYVILPRCGHAFGHQCLNYWIESQSDWPRCPTCREFVYCENEHRVTFDIHGSPQKSVTSQAEEIQKIRGMLHKPPCQKCVGRRGVARWFDRQRVAGQNQNRSASTNIWIGLSGL